MNEAKKTASKDKLQARIDAWKTTIDSYRARAREADADARIKLENEIDQLEAQRTEAARKLASLKESGAGARDDASKALDSIVLINSLFSLMIC